MSEIENPVTPGDPIIWDLAVLNPGDHFNTLLGAYTAPVHGYYQQEKLFCLISCFCVPKGNKPAIVGDTLV